MFRHELSADDRERLASGGPLSEMERVIMEQLVCQYFKWVTKGGGYSLKWSDQWQDGLHVTYPPFDDNDGNAYFSGERVRTMVLGYFSEPEPEPEPENGLLVNEDTADFLMAL